MTVISRGSGVHALAGLAVLLAAAGLAHAGTVTTTNAVVGVPVKVEVVDTGVNGVTKTVYLDPRESKTVQVNQGVRLTVYEKGTEKRQAAGSFPGGGTVRIERSGTRWELRHSR